MQNTEAATCLSNVKPCCTGVRENSIRLRKNGLAALQLRQSIFGTESEEAAAIAQHLGLVYGQTDTDKPSLTMNSIGVL